MLRELVHSRQLLAHHFETSLTSFFPLSLLACFLLLRLHVTYYELFILFILLLVCLCLNVKLLSWLVNEILDHGGSNLDKNEV